MAPTMHQVQHAFAEQHSLHLLELEQRRVPIFRLGALHPKGTEAEALEREARDVLLREHTG